jgi:CRISPR/Cas system-associated exonuclease Cas4 (RecB family)
MRPIRSSEIGEYLYCRRAWWYRKTGTPSENQAELAAGTDLHRRHGRQALASLLTRTLGVILLLAALLLLAAYCTARIL